jgi:amino acid adenylation domain-containing protein
VCDERRPAQAAPAAWLPGATADYGAEGCCLHDLVAAWAAREPHAPALWSAGAQVSYAELDRRANQIARHLRWLGVCPETIVGIFLDRVPDLPVSMLAVLKAGGAYLPLDPDHASARHADVLADAGCELVLTATGLAKALPGPAMPVCVDDPAIARALAALPDNAPGAAARPGNAAYVIYTSGSTGRPKGVVVEHRSIVNYMGYCAAEYGIGPGDRVLQFASPAFDVSIFEIFASLANGATVVQARRSALIDPRALSELMRTARVTICDLPPAVPQMLDPEDFPDLRMMNIGGEAVPGALAARWRSATRAVYNIYGPTEVTVTCTDHRCLEPLGEGTVPIGRPIANLSAQVLPDGDGPPDATSRRHGELAMGGVGVARGYLNQAALTAERFTPDPYGNPGGRRYRTGDLVSVRPDGVLEFGGRADAQLKLHGYRIEPSEVEHALAGHPAVARAVVDVVTDQHGERYLAAYLLVTPGGPVPTVAELRARLRDTLPEYMIPSHAVAVPEVLLNDNGKVDRMRMRHRYGARASNGSGG